MNYYNKAVVQNASPNDLVSMVTMLDQEFVYGKNRSLSFASRFPSIYSENNLSNIYAIKIDGEIVSCAAVKVCEWIGDGHNFKFAM